MLTLKTHRWGTNSVLLTVILIACGRYRHGSTLEKKGVKDIFQEPSRGI